MALTPGQEAALRLRCAGLPWQAVADRLHLSTSGLAYRLRGIAEHYEGASTARMMQAAYDLGRLDAREERGR